jgi:hypothetical protein
MTSVQINIWAVLAAAVANVVVGWLWYSEWLLGKPWMALIGKTPEQIAAGYKSSTMVWTVISALVSNLILAIIVAWSGANTLLQGVVVGATVGIGIAFVTSYLQDLWEGRPFALTLIGAGYNLIVFVIAGAIFASWQ